jgi:transcription elongation factor Elf1
MNMDKQDKVDESNPNNLLSCPFCGGDASVGFCGQGLGFYFINCSECNASTDQLSGYNFTLIEARLLWNKRTWL